MIVRLETDADAPAIGELVADVFQSPAEPRLIERLRDEGHILVSLMALAGRRVIGNVVFSRLFITAGREIAAAALAPLAVHRDYQRHGIGSALVKEGLRICRDRGIDAVLVLGDPQYYVRFGFSPELAAGIASRYAGPSFMAIELTPGVLTNAKARVTYPGPFDDLD